MATALGVIIYVYILIVGESGGHNGATQMGPFPDAETCQAVANTKPLMKFDRQCIKVGLVMR